jgi:hypothetical protein
MSFSSSSSSKFSRIQRSISIHDLESILKELSCSNRAQLAPHTTDGTIALDFSCYVYHNYNGHAFVRFTNDDRRTFIKLARAIRLDQKKFGIIGFCSSLEEYL